MLSKLRSALRGDLSRWNARSLPRSLSNSRYAFVAGESSCSRVAVIRPLSGAAALGAKPMAAVSPWPVVLTESSGHEADVGPQSSVLVAKELVANLRAAKGRPEICVPQAQGLTSIRVL